MQGGLKVARIGGIPIAVHFSWLLVFGLITWSLAEGYFPADYPGWRTATYWGIGALASVVFFGSILIHELAHSWIARRNGIPIRGITLFVFGGVAQIGREATSPGVEFRIAIAGPITSFALSGFFAAAGFLARDVTLVAAPMGWLATVNFVVAIFNLVPGLPLDGGRIFRSAVWRWTGSFQGATRAASAAGQMLAFGFIGLGLLMVVRGNVLNGVWLALVGWFLQNAAVASSAEANVRELLGGATVAQVMVRDCPRISGDVTLERLVHTEVLGAGRRCFLVTDDGHLQGLLTLHEVKAVPRDRWPEVRAGEVMTALEKLTTIEPGADLFQALEKMDDARVAQLPVVAGEAWLGMIGREQVLHYIRTRAELGI